MVDAGCECVYVVDSAGALVPDGVTDRVAALVQELGDEAQVGFHAHDNLGLAVANSVLAHRAGARQLDGSLRGLGAGAGNAKTELGERYGVPAHEILIEAGRRGYVGGQEDLIIDIAVGWAQAT
jgi:isopropylmalate/homocitrate/citramalate synthase